MASAIKIEDWERSTKKNYYYNAAHNKSQIEPLKFATKITKMKIMKT